MAEGWCASSRRFLCYPDGRLYARLDQGPAVARMLGEAVRRGIVRDSIGQIVEAIGIDASSRSEAGVLSVRELRVPRLMAGGASNQQTADQLVVTVGTIKSHVSNILGRLDARKRREAVARARELGLLQI